MNDKTNDHRVYAFASMLAVLAGFINGALGTGGGIIMLFIIRYLAKREGRDERDAFARTVLSVMPMSLVSAVMYCINTQGLFAMSAKYLPFAFLGGAAGGFLTGRIKTTALSYIMGAVLILSGLVMGVRELCIF